MSPRHATRIINIVRDDAASGKNYVDGDVSDDFLVDLKVCFVGCPSNCTVNIWVRRSGSIESRRGRFPACNWYGRIVPACFRGKRDPIQT
jgi:hypothetical protein